MADSQPSNPRKSGRQAWRWWAIRALALVAASLSAYLAWASWQFGPIAGCGEGSSFDCDEVLGSRWSLWLGIPVSLLGVLAYVAMLVCSWPAAQNQGSWARVALSTLALSAVGSAIWFVAVQAIDIGSYCPYCLTVHTCGLIILGLLAWESRQKVADHNYDQMRSILGVGGIPDTTEPNQGSFSKYRIAVPVLAATLGLLALIGGQLLLPAETMQLEFVADAGLSSADTGLSSEVSKTHQQDENVSASVKPHVTDKPVLSDDQTDELPPAPASTSSMKLPAGNSNSSKSTTGNIPRQLKLPGLRETIDLTIDPLIGNPSAKHVFVEYMDYTCPVCRKMHTFIRETIERYGGQFALLVRHAPFSLRCNPFIIQKKTTGIHVEACDYTFLAMSVWKLAPDQFPEFHDWLLASKEPPTLRDAKLKAIELVGTEVLTNESILPEFRLRLIEHCGIVHSKGGAIPLLFTQVGVIRGLPASSEKWHEVLQSKLGFQPSSP